jgi:hypothetical protein
MGGKKIKLSLLQPVEAQRVVRQKGFHIQLTDSSEVFSRTHQYIKDTQITEEVLAIVTNVFIILLTHSLCLEIHTNSISTFNGISD